MKKSRDSKVRSRHRTSTPWSRTCPPFADARGIVAIFGRRRTSHGSGLGVYRWVVERTLAWLHRFRRLAVRYERHDRVHHTFLTLGCALICWNYLKSTGRVF